MNRWKQEVEMNRWKQIGGNKWVETRGGNE